MTRLTFGLIVVALAGHAGAPAARAAEPARVRALLLLDTSDPMLAPGVARDRESMERFLETHLPAERYTLDVLTGKAATPDRVFDYYKTLAVAPGDTLLFYYSGHGSIRPETGHTLELKRGAAPLPRSALKKAMADKGARLTVVLTDCCSDRFPNTQAAGPAARVLNPPMEPTALANRLFFDPRGKIDLTAADKDVAYADDFRGGYFTYALCRVAGRNKDKPVEWKEFADAVRKQTTEVHQKAIEEGVAPKLRSGERLQQPTEMEPIPGAAGTAVTAVVGLTNPTEGPIEIEYRWSDSQPWSKMTIPAGSKRALGAKISGGDSAEAPALRVRVNEKEHALPAKVWENEGTPRFNDGKIYRFGAKPAGKAASRSLAPDATPQPADGDNPPAYNVPTPTAAK